MPRQSKQTSLSDYIKQHEDAQKIGQHLDNNMPLEHRDDSRAARRRTLKLARKLHEQGVRV